MFSEKIKQWGQMKDGNVFLLREKQFFPKIRLVIPRMGKIAKNKLNWTWSIVETLWKRNLEKGILCVVKLAKT